MTTFETKDSGRRVEFDSGMMRDVSDGNKMRPDLLIPAVGANRPFSDAYQLGALLGIGADQKSRYMLEIFLGWWVGEETSNDLFSLMVERDGPLLQRAAELMARGAAKYTPRNWELADGPEELERFRESAFRHFVQYLRGDTDEDHAAAVVFNVRGYEWLKRKLDSTDE